jgi:hypothetical protein
VTKSVDGTLSPLATKRVEGGAYVGPSYKNGIYDSSIRCGSCGAMLAKMEDDIVCVRRGDLQISILSPCRAAMVCHRRECRRLTVLQVSERKKM